jgi:tRNA-modifying protein YgfZ
MSRRDVLTATGPDTWPFLQSLLSQDLDALGEGERKWTLLLTPQGKIDVLAGITRVGDDALLDTEPGWGAYLVDALTRYKIRTKVEFALQPAPEVDDAMAAQEESERIADGVPRLGAELDDSVIPQEAFLEEPAVSFTKGCFVGQELVCRIDTRGHVNRFLRRLVPNDPAVTLPVGAEITVGEKIVGTVTSSAAGVALGFVRREVEPPATGTVDGVGVTISLVATIATT